MLDVDPPQIDQSICPDHQDQHRYDEEDSQEIPIEYKFDDLRGRDREFFLKILSWQVAPGTIHYLSDGLEILHLFIMLAKILPSLLRPEVYLEISDSTATILD